MTKDALTFSVTYGVTCRRTIRPWWTSHADAVYIMKFVLSKNKTFFFFMIDTSNMLNATYFEIDCRDMGNRFYVFVFGKRESIWIMIIIWIIYFGIYDFSGTSISWNTIWLRFQNKNIIFLLIYSNWLLIKTYNLPQILITKPCKQVYNCICIKSGCFTNTIIKSIKINIQQKYI